MTDSIFQEPSAYGVARIQAETSSRNSRPYACLRLILSGSRGVGAPRPCDGEFEIYGDYAMLEKFEQIADAINRIFAPETADESND